MTRGRSSARDSLLLNVTHLSRVPDCTEKDSRSPSLAPCSSGNPKKRTQDYRSHNSVSFSTSSTSISIYPFLFSSLPIWSACHPRNLRGCSRRLQEDPRIGKAQELLLMKGETLSMVAVATGFAAQSHFTRTFKRVTGVTPHDWRQN